MPPIPASAAPPDLSYLQTFPPREQTPLEPRVAAALEAYAKLPPIESLSPTAARVAFAARCDTEPKLNDAVARVDNKKIAGPASEIPIRIYTPDGTGPFPLVVFFHGGGWVIGNLETHDDLCRSLCNRAKAVVVAVDYRLAPEHKFPAPLDDCYAATKWCAAHAGELNADAKKLAVAGDSAGGNLAAAVCLQARDEKGPAIARQLLLYPVTNADFDNASYHLFATGFGLTRGGMKYFWNHYLAKSEEAKNPLAAPLLAETVADVPPALIITAQYDVLRDEGEAYAARLHAAGVPVTCTRYEGLVHGFARYGAALENAKKSVDHCAAFLSRE